MTKIEMNARMKLQKQIHDLEGVTDAYERSGHRGIVRGHRRRLKKLRQQLAKTPKEKDAMECAFRGWDGCHE